MKDNWVGAIVSFLLVAFFVVVVVVVCMLIGLKADYDKIVTMYEETERKVENHERIMKAYEFYNWHYSLKMFEEEDKQE